MYVAIQHSVIFVAASNQTRLDTRSKARRPIKGGDKGRGGQKRAEARALLVYAAHRLTWCNVSVMRQAVSRTQMWVRARMPVYGLNLTRGLVSYVGYKGDKSAAHQPGGSLVETRSLKAPSLPLFLLQSHAPDRSPEQALGCSPERT